jgi:hypothetical protein
MAPQPATCPLCREWVDPTDATLQYAVELHLDPLGYGEAREGAGAFFHAACYPWVRGYRPKPLPSGWTALAEDDL